MSTASSTFVGLLACQQTPFLRELNTQVISCSEEPDSEALFQVELTDTVIFPEGGGQPSDTGRINGVPVKYARRDGLRAIHFVSAPIPAGTPVCVKVDFKRRLDHMQQHTGQHLLSAVLKNGWGLETVSWNLGATISHVELKASNNLVLSPSVLSDIESKCNDLIFEALPIATHVAEQEPAMSPSTVPCDYVGGVIRHVQIGVAGAAIDNNACCGTHLANTAQIQVLKLAGVDRIRGGNTRLFFYVGARVREYAEASLARDKQLAGLLSCPPETQCEAVDRLVKHGKASLKALKALRVALAPLVAQDLHRQLIAQSDSGIQTAVYYCENGDGPFASSIGSELAKLMTGSSLRWLTVVASGTKTDGGPLVVSGSKETDINDAVKCLTLLLGVCKGGMTHGAWRGKAASFTQLTKFNLSALD
ncbi:hypothetical protein GGI20_000698 [Coemansia sp. BCRC 34301]|nr:hypothetical protein GGI20_000698 [Coemansia sp. BCRC 34301]